MIAGVGADAAVSRLASALAEMDSWAASVQVDFLTVLCIVSEIVDSVMRLYYFVIVTA